MSVVGQTAVIAGVVAFVAAARVGFLILSYRSDEVTAVRRALVAHGAAWTVLVAAAVIRNPLDLPLAVVVPASVMGAAWGLAWVLLGRTYGLGAAEEPSSRVGACPDPPRRAERWVRRSVGARSPPRR